MPPVGRRQLLAALAAGLAVPLPASLAGCTEADPVTPAPAPTREYRYGNDEAQVVDLWLPESGAPPTGRTAVLVHGGFWQVGYDRSLEDAIAVDLVERGWAVWNVDYRPVGAGGGWPTTLFDVATAIDLLATVAPRHGLSTERLAFVGHSAGGQLALWAAARERLPGTAPGAGPAVLPAAVVSQAGVNDLREADRLQLGGGAVAQLLGGSIGQVPERYAVADPAQLLPIGVPLLLVSGEDDPLVPPIPMTRRFGEAARAAGDDVAVRVVIGEDHFAHLDSGSRCWAIAAQWLAEALPDQIPS